MNAKESEQLFEDYLKLHRLKYQQDFLVNPGNVDFRVESDSYGVLCDVKEIRDSVKGIKGMVDAHTHIRIDIKELREKFGKNRPNEPCVLVSMNFSSNFFTGLTVARAMLGDIGIYFDKETKQIISDVHHLPRGNAAMTEKQNRTISGVLVFDRANDRHCLFTNPFCEHPVPDGFFPSVRVVQLTRESAGNKLVDLSNFRFPNF